MVKVVFLETILLSKTTSIINPEGVVYFVINGCTNFSLNMTCIKTEKRCVTKKQDKLFLYVV